MLLENQLFANNKKGLGFDEESVLKQTTNHFVGKKRVIPKCTNCGVIGHSENNCWYKHNHKTIKQFRKPNNTKINSLKYKKT